MKLQLNRTVLLQILLAEILLKRKFTLNTYTLTLLYLVHRRMRNLPISAEPARTPTNKAIMEYC